jgi:hypothetical protein
MLMTPMRLLILRIYCLTLGRVWGGSALVRRLLVWAFVRRSKRKYLATSRYFDPADLEPRR